MTDKQEKELLVQISLLQLQNPNKEIVLMGSSESLLKLGLDETKQTFDSIFDWNEVSNHKVEKGEVLFPRLDASIEVPLIKELMEG